MSYEQGRAASFYDEFGEREWTRFEDDRTPWTSLDVHRHYLHRFVHAGNRVLEIGAGPGRFTIELARLGANVVVADISPVQLDLNRRKLAEAELEERVEERVLADVTNLTLAAAELARVTRAGGHVLVSVMSLVGSILAYLDIVLDLARRDGNAPTEEIVRTGILPEAPDYGHLDMRLFRWRELRELLEPHGEIVAVSAAGLLRADPDEPELRDLLTRLELKLAAEPGAIDCGPHMLAVLRR